MKHNIFIFFKSPSIRENIYYSTDTEAHSELSQISVMELFTKTRNGLKALAIFLNSFILDAWLGSKYASEMCFSRVIFNRIDKWDSSDMETIQSVVCRVRLFLSTRLYQIHYFQSLSQQIQVKTHQQLYQNMVSKISTVNKKIMGLFLSI